MYLCTNSTCQCMMLTRILQVDHIHFYIYCTDNLPYSEAHTCTNWVQRYYLATVYHSLSKYLCLILIAEIISLVESYVNMWFVSAYTLSPSQFKNRLSMHLHSCVTSNQTDGHSVLFWFDRARLSLWENGVYIDKATVWCATDWSNIMITTCKNFILMLNSVIITYKVLDSEARLICTIILD